MSGLLKCYYIHCVTEGITLQSDFVATYPTTCPHDYTHEILPVTDADIIQTNIASQVAIFQGSNYTKYYKGKGYNFDVNNVIGSVTTFDIVTKYQCLPRGMIVISSSQNVGDEFSIYVNPDTLTGLTTANSISTDTVIHVSPTVISNIQPGLTVSITDNVNKSILSECSDVDKVNNTITLSDQLGYNFATGSKVLLSLPRLQNIFLYNAENLVFGLDNMYSNDTPKGTVARVYYTNNTGGDKKFSFILTTKFGQ